MTGPEWLRELAEEMGRVNRADPAELLSWARMMAPKIADRLRMTAREIEDARDDAVGDAWEAEHDRNVLEGLIQHNMRTGKIAKVRIYPSNILRTMMKERAL